MGVLEVLQVAADDEGVHVSFVHRLKGVGRATGWRAKAKLQPGGPARAIPARVHLHEVFRRGGIHGPLEQGHPAQATGSRGRRLNLRMHGAGKGVLVEGHPPRNDNGEQRDRQAIQLCHGAAPAGTAVA